MITDQTIKTYKQALASVLRVYNLGGFRVTTIHCDNEFRPIMDEVGLTYHIQMNYANPQEHVPEAERNNRVIKERVRAVYHRLPYTHLPCIMVKF